MELPNVAMTNMIQLATTVKYFNQSASEDDPEVDELAVVPAEFQLSVSPELFSFANDIRPVKFILA